jgi:microcystin-dependent protein
MSDYNIQVSWSGKDALADSDPDKVISGADFNTEFTAVKTAVNSKANLNGNSGEDFDATTQAAGNNTNKVATTEFVTTATTASTIADMVYPIGAIFTTVTAYADSDAVVTAIGGSSWSTFGAGKVIVGLDSTDTDFDTIEKTGGAKTDSHILTIAEMPAHTHTTVNSNSDSGSGKPATGSDAAEGSGVHTSDSTGGGGSHTHDIVQPYIVVYMWKRLT